MESQDQNLQLTKVKVVNAELVCYMASKKKTTVNHENLLYDFEKTLHYIKWQFLASFGRTHLTYSAFKDLTTYMKTSVLYVRDCILCFNS